MLKARRGFTLVEISLFLAITAVIFAGIVAGTQTSIYWQRYNDSVQSFAEFLRAEYSRVANVQNPTGTGVSDKIIYGRLITFDATDGAVNSYSVVGDDITGGLGNDTILAQLENAHTRIGGYYNDGGDFISAGLDESYIPKWGSRIQTEEFGPFPGTILIIRHPETGTIYTYFSYTPFTFENAILDNGSFVSEDLSLCVNPEGNTNSSPRGQVTITKNAHNASGVTVNGECPS